MSEIRLDYYDQSVPPDLLAPAPEPEPEEPIEPEEFDPAAYTIAEVSEYVDAHPDERADVLDRERAGKGRTTLVAKLDEGDDDGDGSDVEGEGG